MNSASERLKWARKRAGYDRATEAARGFGWTISTYLGHENGDRALTLEAAKRYARSLKVRWEWLLEGEGAPTLKNVVGIKGRIGAGAEILVDAEQIPHEGLSEIEVPFPVPDGAVALEVEGNSMYPRYDPGDVIICTEYNVPADEISGQEAAVMTEDGRRFLKRVLPVGGDRFDLESHNAPMIRGVRLTWAGKVIGVVRSGTWERIKTSHARKRKAGRA